MHGKRNKNVGTEGILSRRKERLVTTCSTLQKK